MESPLLFVLSSVVMLHRIPGALTARRMLHYRVAPKFMFVYEARGEFVQTNCSLLQSIQHRHISNQRTVAICLELQIVGNE
jgi:hypothetical protein